LSLKLADISGNPFIGVFCRRVANLVICPHEATEEFITDLRETLNVEAVKATLGGTNLHGALMAANSKGFIVPYFYDLDEIDGILKKNEFDRKELDISGSVSEDPHTAWGNNVLASEKVALINPDLSEDSVELVGDTLGVEVIKGSIAGIKTVGSVAALNSKGMVVHPKASEEERENLSELFSLEVQISTANFGSPYLGASMIVNDKGALVGKRTSGVEMNRIENSLDII
jgi:translation initiation factor 6